MFAALELSQAVRTRRCDMGLTQAAVSRLSGLSRTTVNQVENGTIQDLSVTRTARLLDVLGLNLSVSAARPKRDANVPRPTPALTLAARSASVSYREAIAPELLGDVLLHGDVRTEFAPHVNALLEDASTALLAAVVEQLHHTAGVERAAVWSAMRAVAQRLGSRRDIWQ